MGGQCGLVGGLLGLWWVAGFVGGLPDSWYGWMDLCWVCGWFDGCGLLELWIWVARIAKISLLEFWVVEIGFVLAGIMGWFAEIGLLELWVAKIGLLELVRC